MPTLIWISTGTNSASVSFNTAANYSTGTAPATGDTIIFTGTAGTANVFSNLATGLTGLQIYADASYVGQIGQVINGAALGLKFGGNVVVGRDTGSTTTPVGSRQLIFDGDTNVLTATVLSTSQSSLSGNVPPVLFQGSNLTVDHTGGLIGIAATAGSTAAGVVSLSDGPATANPNAYIGNGATISTLTASAGQITVFSDSTFGTITLSGSAIATAYGMAPFGQMTIGTGATMQYYGGGNITTVSVNGVFDRQGDNRTITVTNMNAYGGSQFLMDNGKPNSIIRTNFNLVNCRISDIRITLPIGEKP